MTEKHVLQKCSGKAVIFHILQCLDENKILRIRLQKSLSRSTFLYMCFYKGSVCLCVESLVMFFWPFRASAKGIFNIPLALITQDMYCNSKVFLCVRTHFVSKLIQFGFLFPNCSFFFLFSFKVLHMSNVRAKLKAECLISSLLNSF